MANRPHEVPLMFQRLLNTAICKCLTAQAQPALLFLGLFLAGAELGHLLSFSEHFATFWPPSGIYLAALLISNSRRWPTIILLALLASVISDFGWTGDRLSLILGYWCVTTAEAVGGAWLLRRFVAFPFSCESLKEVIGLSILGAIVTSMLGAFLGAHLVVAAIPGTETALGWKLWWNSHTMGVVIFTPALLVLFGKRREWSLFSIPRRLVLEAILAFGSMVIFARLVYSADTQWFSFLVFPILIWIALRFEIWGVCAANLLRISISIWSTRAGFGPFAGDYPATEQAVILNSFLNITSASLLLLAAIMAERRRAALALKESELRYRDLLENIGNLVHSVNAEGTILYTNRAWRETLGYTPQDVASLSIFQVVHPDDLATYRQKLTHLLKGRNSERYEIRFLTKDGRTLIVEGSCNCRIVDGQANTTRSIYSDITERREHDAQLDLYRRKLESANAQLRHLATTDGLTGLFNRRAFQERLNEEVERAGRHLQLISLLIVDVDHFKQVNDIFGHQAGDEVLRRVAQVLQENARSYDCVARFGGEEFAVILPKTDEAESMIIAERLRTQIASVSYAGRQITASLGIATLAAEFTVSDTEANGALLIHDADAAMYHSKQHGRNRVTHASSLALPSTARHLTRLETLAFDCELAKADS